jgi:MtN3 and saliva related transmembrane protein
MTTLGLLSGAITTFSFLFQVLRTVRTRSAADLSLGWLVWLTVGICGWLTYGLLSADVPVSLANAVTLALVLVLVGFKVRSERPQQTP